MRLLHVGVSLLTILVLQAGCASTHHAPAAESVASSAQQYESLRAQLIDLQERDQEIRAAVVAAMQTAERGEGGSMQFEGEGAKAMRAMSEIDAESSAFLDEMIAEYGWPTIDMVGKDGAHAAWLLAQHADARPELQQRVLELMEPLVERRQAEGRLFAMLTDRVLSGRGEPQLYGTQFTNDDEGVLRPSPTSDWDTIDERRAKVGLEPIAAYAKRIGETYNEPVSTVPMPIE